MGNQGKILIIDDESTHLLLLQTILQEEGYHTEIVDHPEKGLKLLKENNYQVLILDIMMPGMDGFEVLEKIRKDKKMKKLHVIIISAKTDSWSIKNAMDCGAFDYLTKPINIKDVKNKVKSAMVENVLGNDE